MASVVNSITIDRPIEDVFAVVTDVTKTGRWFPADVEEYWTTPPPHGVGSVRHAIVTVGGRRAENDATVTEFDPPHRGVLVGNAAGRPVDGNHRVRSRLTAARSSPSPSMPRRGWPCGCS